MRDSNFPTVVISMFIIFAFGGVTVESYVSSVKETQETHWAMENGYEQVWDEKAGRVLWKKSVEEVE